MPAENQNEVGYYQKLQAVTCAKEVLC